MKGRNFDHIQPFINVGLLKKYSIFVSLFLVSGVAFATDALIYINEYKGYTRFIFDLPKSTSYDLEKGPDGVKINIKEGYNYKIPTSFQKNSYVAGVRILQQKSNLITDIKISSGYKVRELQYGNSLVFDIVPQEFIPPLPKQRPKLEVDRTGVLSNKDNDTNGESKGEDKEDVKSDPKAPDVLPVNSLNVGGLPDKQQAITKNTIINLNFARRTQLCVFNIGAFVYIVADNKNLKSKIPIHKKIDHAKIGIWRLRTFLNPSMAVSPVDTTGRKWHLNITKTLRQHSDDENNALEYIVDKANGKHFVIRDIIKPVIFKIFDQDLSTYFNVVMLRDPYRRNHSVQHFNNFALLSSAIGYACQSNSHDFEVLYREESVIIKPGMHSYMSPPADRHNNRDVVRIEHAPLLSFYKPPGNGNVYGHVKRLSKKLLKSKYKGSIYHKIADLYALSKIYDRSIVFYKKALKNSVRPNVRLVLSAKLGIFSLLNGKMSQAYTYLFAPELSMEKSLDPWRGLYMMKNNKLNKAFNHFANIAKTLPLVGKPNYNMLLLSAMELYLGEGKDIRPLLKLFDEVIASGSELDHMNYLKGQNYIKLGMIKNALKGFDMSIIGGGHDNLYNLSAKVHKVIVSYDYGMLKIQDAIKSLEDMRYNSKQGHLQFLVIDKLRHLYFIKRQYRKAIEVTMQIGRRFPKAYKEQNMAEFNQNAFCESFINWQQSLGNYHNVIVFFERYKDLMPKVKEKIAKIHIPLLEAYFKLDLLDEAEEIIIYLNNKLGAVNPNTITRLGEIYLIDDRPQSAVMFLSKLKTLNKEQKYLMAKSLIKAKQWFRAKQFLKKAPQNESFDSLRLELAWSNNDFYYAEEVLEKIIIRQSQTGKINPLTIINLASAVRRQNNFTKLYKLSKMYEKQMKDTKYYRLFNYITKVNSFPNFKSEDVSSTLKDIDNLSDSMLDVLK